MKKLISKLRDRIFWWATEGVYDEGMEMGVLMGSLSERYRIIRALEATDSACADWAVAIIKEKK